MQYGQFEEALVHMFSIDEERLGAFQARLRHLRGLGIPNIPKRGSGNTVYYREKDLLATFVALAVQTLGSTPTVSAQIANFSTRYFEKLKSKKEDIFLIVMHSSKTRGEFTSWLIKVAPDVERASLAINPLGGDTYAFIVAGATKAGSLATDSMAVASSVINLSSQLGSPRREP
jgi:hypothetical protein